jgi:hypothetical protein
MDLACWLTAPPHPPTEAIAKKQRRHEEELFLFGGSSRAAVRGTGQGSTSLRRADAAQVCGDVGSVAVNGIYWSADSSQLQGR